MFTNDRMKSDDLFAPISFGGGGGGDGGGGGGAATRGAIGVANGVVGRSLSDTTNISDPQGVWGRPTFDEGDAYSGDQNYGEPDGR